MTEPTTWLRDNATIYTLEACQSPITGKTFERNRFCATVCGGPGTPREQVVAAAEFMRRAANSHEGLVAVCRRLAKLKVGPRPTNRAEWIGNVLEIAEAARAALDQEKP